MRKKTEKNNGSFEPENTIRKNRQIDMLHGPLFGKIVLFALPLAASSIMQQLFNSADVAVVGRFAGSHAMAAVGGNSSVISLLINMFVGLSVGANVVIANYVGRQDEKKVSEAVHTVMSMALISGLILLILGIFIAEPVLRLINTPDDVISLAVIYLRIYFAGMPFFMVYNFGSAILRSVGDTRRPMYILFISGVINVCLNLILVIKFHLGVAGVGIATVFSELVSAVIIVRILMKEESLIHFEPSKLSLQKAHVKKIIQIGAPAGIQGMVFSLSNVCIQSAINSFGSNAIAGSAAAVNFEFFTYFMTNAFSQAAVTFTSQNFGAAAYDRCRKIFRLSLFSGIFCTSIMCAAFVLGRNLFIRFYSVEPAVMDYATVRMLHVESLAFLCVLYEVGAAAMRGMGYSLSPAILTLIGSCAFRFLWVFTVFKKYNTYEMLMNVYPISWVITATMVLSAYFVIRKRLFSPDRSADTGTN